jgi:hypothetical protein
MSGRNSVVECQLPKLDVAGSTPVARSKISLNHFRAKRVITEWSIRVRFRSTSKVTALHANPSLLDFINLQCAKVNVRQRTDGSF